MFTAFEMCDDDGILLGTNEHNNSLVVMDIFNSRKYKNANLICMGTSGAGKSFTIQMIATRLRRMGVQTFVIAPLKGHEFIRCCRAYGGQYIKLSTGSSHCINIMEIRKMDTSLSELLDEEEEQQSYLSKKIDSLLIFFSLLMPEMTNVEEQLLDEAILNTYAEKGITSENQSLADPENPERFKPMPILEDLYNQLLKEPRAERIAIILKRFVSGSAKAFNAQTNITLDKYCVFDISQLKGRMLSVGMFICLDLIWDKAKENRIVSKAIIIDELWNLIGGSASAIAAEFVFECWKIARGYSCSAIGCTQDIEDFFSLENGKYGKALINNSKTKIILNLEPHEAEMVQEVLRLTDTEIHKIKNFERGHGIISTNSNNIAVSFKASQKDLELITTDKSELQRIAREKEQRRAAAAMFGEQGNPEAAE
jgi:type IV secretory pathway VirB4 component